MMKAGRITFFFISGLVLALFSAVTYYSLPLAPNNGAYLSFLSALSALVAIAVVRELLFCKGLTVHLWSIFVILLVGYYVKFAVLAVLYGSAEPGLVGLTGGVAASLLGDARVVITSYELATVAFCAFGLAVIAVTILFPAHIAGNSLTDHGDDGFRASNARSAKSRLLAELLGLTIFVYTVCAAIQLEYGIGVGFLRQESLPFRLAGVLIAVQKYIVPLALLFVIWAADRMRMVKTAGIAVALYLFYGIASGLITTSKASLIFVIATLAGLWVASGTLNARRAWLIAGAVVFSIGFSAYLSAVRFLRIDLTMSVWDTIMTPLLPGSAQLGLAADQADTGFLYLAILLRSVGMDALLGIVAYDPSFSFDRIISLVTGATSLDQVYGQEVLQRDSYDVSAFSPSLVGGLYILTGSIWATGIAVFLYTIIWHAIFAFVSRSNLVLRPALLAMLLLSVLLYTSEGTIETMPVALFAVALAGFAGERVVKVLFGRTGYKALKGQPLPG